MGRKEDYVIFFMVAFGDALLEGLFTLSLSLSYICIISILSQILPLRVLVLGLVGYLRAA